MYDCVMLESSLKLCLQEGQQLSLLETERRAALRQHEDELAAELHRLDDIAKEQRLRQLESMEQAYQTQLQASALLHKCGKFCIPGTYTGQRLEEASLGQLL